ncbi:MAG: hypothetical protein ACRDRL_00275 [Sciscionella sp.]
MALMQWLKSAQGTVAADGTATLNFAPVPVGQLVLANAVSTVGANANAVVTVLYNGQPTGEFVGSQGGGYFLQSGVTLGLGFTGQTPGTLIQANLRGWLADTLTELAAAPLAVPTSSGSLPSSGGGGTAAPLASQLELELSNSGTTVVLSYTPTSAGLFRISIYFRVQGTGSQLTITVQSTDAAGITITKPVNAVSYDIVESYSIPDFPLYSVAGKPIIISFDANVGGMIYASADIGQD